MTKAGAYKRRLRMAMFQRQDGQCHWCQAPMTMAPDGTIPKIRKDSATFDHVHPRGDPQRLAEIARHWCEIVLACYRCNQKRDQAFRRQLTAEQRAALSTPRAKRQRRDESIRLTFQAYLAAQPTDELRVPLEQLAK